MSQPRAPRGFVARRIYQLRHAPQPVFRAVLASSATRLGDARGSVSQIAFGNDTAYRHYAVVFLETKGIFNGARHVQLAEARLARSPSYVVPEALGMKIGRAHV